MTAKHNPLSPRPSRARVLGSLLLLGCSLCITAARGDQSPTLPVPQDFAWGQNLDSAQSGAFFRLPLPEQIYGETAWPDLRDVRVFDQTGHPVPYALQTAQARVPAQAKVPLTVFPLQNSAPVRQQDGDQAITLTGPDGAKIMLTIEADAVAFRRSWLLVTSEGDARRELDQITLHWQVNGNRQAWGVLITSNDMQNWEQRGENIPLYDLQSGDDRLLLNKIKLDEYGLHARYWLLLVYADKALPMPVITGAEGREAQKVQDAFPVMMNLPGTQTAEGQAVYALPRPQLLSVMNVIPASENTVLPLAVETRSAADAPWQPLSRTVFYRLGEQKPPAPLPLPALQPVQAIRLTAINTSWNNKLPLVQVGRPQVDLIFNGAGKGPWLLAWGAHAVGEAALPLTTLLPPSVDANRLAKARAENRVTLGGESRLSAASPVEQQSDQRQMLLWGLLVLGAAGLALLAWRLWREIGGQRPPRSPDDNG